MPTHNDFLTIMQQRGFVHQCTDMDGLKKVMEQPITAYIGFDCTASSLHVGSLMQIMVLRWLQKCGHTPIVLMGGGTTKVGDPSGKDEARKLLHDNVIADNMNGIKKVFKKYLSFDGEGGNALMVNNDDWLNGLGLIDFMRKYGRHFSVNRMLAMDSVKIRLDRESHLSLLEFMYSALQAYDFVELYSRHECTLQIGGSDQWGNILSGAELIRKLYIQAASGDSGGLISPDDYDTMAQKNIGIAFGLTTPLITTSSGAKMGKTANGAVWLNDDMLPAYDYWQFWRNTEDGDVERFLKFFTELPLEEIAKITSDTSGAGINEAKKILANEATTLCHGEAAALAAAETARKTFEEGGMGGALPEVTFSKAELAEAKINAVLVKLGFAESNGEAKKLVAGGGVKLNDKPVTDANYALSEADFTDGTAKLSKGKKHHARIVLS